MNIRMEHFKSDFSKPEAPFFTEGQPIIGESNELTDLFKYVGKYIALKADNKPEEIASYHPKEDVFFLHENKGYTEIKRRVNTRNDLEHYVSRRYLVNISRKWCMSRIVLSYDTYAIIDELYKYIFENDYLRNACLDYITGNKVWEKIMPIQFWFLSARRDDQHKEWKKALKIINKLSVYSFGEE